MEITELMLTSNAESAKNAMAMIAKSGLYPTFSTTERVLVAMLQAENMGVSPIALLNNAFVIPNQEGGFKLGYSAQFLIGLCYNDPNIILIEEDPGNDEKQAIVRITRKWPSGNVIYEGKFTIEDAERAGLLKKAVWQKYPKQMLLARAQAQAARKAIPNILSGCYTSEELQSVEVTDTEPRDVTPPSGFVDQEDKEKFDFASRFVEKNEDKYAEKSPDDRSWEADIMAKLEAIKGKPMGGMQKVWQDVIDKMGTMGREEAILRVAKLHALQDVEPGHDTSAYIKAISAAATVKEIRGIVINFLNSGPATEKTMEADKKISALTKKILEFAGTQNQGEKETIIAQVDEIGKRENREMALVSLENYARQLGIMGVEDEEIY